MNKYILFITLALIGSSLRPAHAQVPIPEEPTLVNQYIAATYEQRSAAWWNALGRQLTLAMDVPVKQINAPTLQNIIFFARTHRERVRLNDAAPRLLEVYLHHEQEAFRMMALVALHAIGDEGTMQDLSAALRQQQEGRVRRLTLAVLRDHYHHR